MPRIDIVRETPAPDSARAQQLSAIFDMPMQDRLRVEWHGNLPIEDEPWNVGLIVGPSGAGKTQIATELFGAPLTFDWPAPSVIDNFANVSIDEATKALGAVGFNTIPAWVRPYGVLSVGEQFRANLARALLSDSDPIYVDEFTSNVDRQIGKIASHAVQKYVRRHKKRFVAVSCHSDLVDWLQPDWVLEPAGWVFTRRRPKSGHPALEASIAAVDHAAWGVFAPYHYLTRELSKAAKSFVMFIEDEPVALEAFIYRPTLGTRRAHIAASRLVCLPDWQGLGLAYILIDKMASLYAAQDCDSSFSPAHPAVIRALDRNPNWRMTKKPGAAGMTLQGSVSRPNWRAQRPAAAFMYCGPRGDREESVSLLGDLSALGGVVRRGHYAGVGVSRLRAGGAKRRPLGPRAAGR